jgi:hypothetical protein
MIKSRSALNKSRVILICLLFVGALVELSSFYYVETYATDIFPAAEVSTPFQFANLTISPVETSIDQPIEISLNVLNTGIYEGSYSLSLNINDSAIETRELTLQANETQQVAFTVKEADVGTYNVTIADQTGVFNVLAQPVPLPEALKFSNLILTPAESWPGEEVNVTVNVNNGGSDPLLFMLPFNVNGAASQRVQVELGPHETQTVVGTVTQNAVGSYRVTVGGQGGTLRVVEEGKHTLHIIATRVGFSFTLDGEQHTTPYVDLVDVGPHSVVFPNKEEIQIGGWGLVPFGFVGWSDGTTTTSHTFDVQKETYAISNWIRIVSPSGSCPSLFVWNGTDYAYTSEVSDGAGWLGYLDHFQPDGSMVFSYNYPFDYIKLDNSILKAKNGLYEMKITEMSDEIFYLDSAKIVAIDHPANTDVFSTTSTFIYPLVGQGTMYTVSKNLAPPVSAVNGSGQSVLPLISKMDGAFTQGTRWTWNNITLNLGDLSSAKEIKLVVGAKIVWPTTSAGGTNFMKYANQPGIMPSPPPFMEVKAANGSWIRVPDERQFPLPDVTDEVFVVNLTGLFPTNNYELRINTYQDIRFDYIAVDTSVQQNISVHNISPTYANLQQEFPTGSNSTGSFTRFGDVLPLLISADDKFVIGREGDTVSLQFPVDKTPVSDGMVRDYFLVTSCWFKGTGLSYMSFTVNPLPFQAMTSFPYPSNETYPYDAAHNDYLRTYNTRTINLPNFLN